MESPYSMGKMGQAEVETATQCGDRGFAMAAIEIPGSLSNHRHFSLWDRSADVPYHSSFDALAKQLLKKG